jgi:hypothetical protein
MITTLRAAFICRFGTGLPKKLLKNNYLVPVLWIRADSMRIRIQGAKPMQIHTNLPSQKAEFLHEKYTLCR